MNLFFRFFTFLFSLCNFVFQLLSHYITLNFYNYLLPLGFPPPPVYVSFKIYKYRDKITQRVSNPRIRQWLLNFFGLFSHPILVLSVLCIFEFFIVTFAGDRTTIFLSLDPLKKLIVLALAFPIVSLLMLSRIFCLSCYFIEFYWVVSTKSTWIYGSRNTSVQQLLVNQFSDQCHVPHRLSFLISSWFKVFFTLIPFYLTGLSFSALLNFVSGSAETSSSNGFFATGQLLENLSYAVKKEALLNTLLVCLLCFSIFVLILISFLVFYRILIFLFDESANKEFITAKSSIELLLQTVHIDNLFQNFEERKLLIYRLEYLANMTWQLYQRHNKSFNFSSSWLPSHFLALYAFVLERKRWAISPQTTTLHDLQKDLMNLCPIFVSRMYGEFHDYSDYQKWVDDNKHILVSKKSWYQNSLFLLRRFFGLIFPLIVMGYIIVQDKYPFLSNTDVDDSVHKIITYVFFAWFIIGIDVVLSLGVVDSILKAAKGLKDLGK